MRLEREQDAEPARGRRPLVLAGAAGFAVGAVVIGLLWTVSGGGNGPAQDARAACASLDRAGPLPNAYVSQATLAPGVIQHITAARDLSAAAAAGSPLYEQLADHLDGVSRMVISLNFADPAGQSHLARAHELCARV
ncbi:hypothetical protein FPZ12_001145 [Amycolatopsis acidicola]|uniref:Uncharacterized protein n=1 Tax=Amycolatopsis acidicola TaxID=2596893 RepID=A0A5N0VNF3_9PSEU|nr:hypothetical protein [Amycolatopsis acidicola]KAA9166834.1 hypothetical protein FPZ12_001145 [Amycolatopsis acidicola]